jgi:Tfp pilus assembly major pilin PilA
MWNIVLGIIAILFAIAGLMYKNYIINNFQSEYFKKSKDQNAAKKILRINIYISSISLIIFGIFLIFFY